MPLIFVAKNGLNLGGFDLAGINEGLTSGYFSLNDDAWIENLPKWITLSEVIALLTKAAPTEAIAPTQTPSAEGKQEEKAITYILKSKHSVGRKDEHGQPRALFKANIENNVSKAIDQLSGICTGILADGVVTDNEALFFRVWVRNHAILEPVWPFTDILDRVEKVFAHGKIEEEERNELADIMRSICGNDEFESNAIDTFSSQLPLDNPPPGIVFENSEFVVTGRFAFGTRAKVNEAIRLRNGKIKDGFPALTTRYLIIGTFASRDWYNTNYGRKIERAVELRNGSHAIAIVSEEHWKTFIV